MYMILTTSSAVPWDIEHKHVVAMARTDSALFPAFQIKYGAITSEDTKKREKHEKRMERQLNCTGHIA